MEKLQRIKILILDDLGIWPLTQAQTENIMEIIEARDLCASTVVTTQLPKHKIYTAFADPTLADAICDRLFRAAIGITLKGESRRKATPPKVEHWIHLC
jgi:DNA replication protein DnaC